MTEAVALRERAFDDYARLDRCDDAVRAAGWVPHQQMIGGRPSAARGRPARSERTLEGVAACAGHGWLAVERARRSPSVQKQITHASRALAVGRTMGQSDLEVLAVSVLGRATVDAGRWEEGLRLLEEFMAAATAGNKLAVHQHAHPGVGRQAVDHIAALLDGIWAARYQGRITRASKAVIRQSSLAATPREHRSIVCPEGRLGAYAHERS